VLKADLLTNSLYLSLHGDLICAVIVFIKVFSLGGKDEKH